MTDQKIEQTLWEKFNLEMDYVNHIADSSNWDGDELLHVRSTQDAIIVTLVALRDYLVYLRENK